MKTLLVRNGDLNMVGGEFVLVGGEEKLRQDLSHALRESFGTDRFHPRWGSMLPDHIGLVNNEVTATLLQAEVERVVSNYIVLQRALIERVATQGRKPSYGTGEVISSLDGVNVFLGLDWSRIEVRVKTMSGGEVKISGDLSMTTGEVET